MPLPQEQREYTYEDYLSWSEDERCEIIDGIVYNQATPSPVHQKISSNLNAVLYNYLKGKQCIVFPAPFTVRLPLEGGESNEKKNKNIVEPDLVVICDKSKLDNNGYSGAPTLVIEIVSKSSIKRDHILKLNKYEKAGVKEYWIITPDAETITSYILNEQGNYNKPEMYLLGEDEEIVPKVFGEMVIKLTDVFERW